MGGICSCIYVRSLQSRAENGRVSTYDVDVPLGPCWACCPHGERHTTSGEGEGSGQEEVGALVHFTGFASSWV
jgi:hypothetical protein